MRTPTEHIDLATALTMRLKTDAGITLPPMAVRLIALHLEEAYEDGRKSVTARTP